MRVKVAQVSLNQTVIDFDGNMNRIIESIKKSKEMGCRFRSCQEAEIPGYSCEDHFKELDTYKHCWKVVAEIVKDPELTKDILVETTMPVMHRGSAYNCKVIIHEGKIVLLRPKIFMADGDNYRESRYFSVYNPKKGLALEDFLLSPEFEEINGQTHVPFGLCNIRTSDGVIIGLEICEEVWRLDTKTRNFILECDFISNSNSSHFGTNKIYKRINCIKSRTSNAAGAYLYTNTLGCDGGRLYFDSTNICMINGDMISMGENCPLKDMVIDEVVIDIGKIRQRKLTDVNFLREASLIEEEVPIVDVNFNLTQDGKKLKLSPIIEAKVPCEPEQQLLAMSSYLWDYLRKSGAAGMYLPLSGGADSGVTALVVYYMAERILAQIKEDKHSETLNDLRKIIRDDGFIPNNAQDIVNQLLFTCYLGTSNSSSETKERAENLANFIGSKHKSVDITYIIESFSKAIQEIMGMAPRYKSQGGTWNEDIALQNIQARSRMVISYMMAQLLPVQSKKQGFLLVLSTGNLDEALVGYFTKYDCSSGDLNLIGSINKVDVHKAMVYLFEKYNHDSIRNIYEAKPSAELVPIQENVEEQSDEKDIGLTFKEIKLLNELRIAKNNGIVSMFESLYQLWDGVDPELIHEKLNRFYLKYMINRHKVEILPPCVFLSDLACDSNRYDLRPFVYNTNLKFQQKEIEDLKLELKNEN